MDEDTAIINTNTRNQKIKNFFISNKKNIIIFVSIIIFIFFGYFAYDEVKKRNKAKLADQYSYLTINFLTGNKTNIGKELIKIVESKDKTYSPLALYFLLDNNIIVKEEKINKLFDILINDTNLENEIKNLIIYKKALFQSDHVDENELLNILKPLISSDTLWKPHALLLLGDFFAYKGEYLKAEEFYLKISYFK